MNSKNCFIVTAVILFYGAATACASEQFPPLQEVIDWMPGMDLQEGQWYREKDEESPSGYSYFRAVNRGPGGVSRGCDYTCDLPEECIAPESSSNVTPQTHFVNEHNFPARKNQAIATQIVCRVLFRNEVKSDGELNHRTDFLGYPSDCLIDEGKSSINLEFRGFLGHPTLSLSIPREDWGPVHDLVREKLFLSCFYSKPDEMWLMQYLNGSRVSYCSESYRRSSLSQEDLKEKQPFTAKLDEMLCRDTTDERRITRDSLGLSHRTVFSRAVGILRKRDLPEDIRHSWRKISSLGVEGKADRVLRGLCGMKPSDEKA